MNELRVTQPASTAGELFDWPIRVYWEDTDAGGIVYHARYLHFFERGRTEWLRQLGIDQVEIKARLGGMFVVQSLQMRYIAPAYLDDLLITHTQLVELGRASCTMRQTLTKNGLLIADFNIRLGFVSAADALPMRLPQVVYDAMTLLLAKE
jgi:acyl-CoA thioester hydrolase